MHAALFVAVERTHLEMALGGKVEPEETSQQAALRELEVRQNGSMEALAKIVQEEAGITAPLQHAGTLLFTTGVEEAAYLIEVYRADEYTGVVTECVILFSNCNVHA